MISRRRRLRRRRPQAAPGRTDARGPWLYPADQTADLPARLLAAEITREKVYLRVHEELPYAASVETTAFEERKDGSVRIEQTIYRRARRPARHRARQGRPDPEVDRRGLAQGAERDPGAAGPPVPTRQGQGELGRGARASTRTSGWTSTSRRSMEFEDEAFVLAARPYGETGAIVEVLTASHGRWAAHVAGGASRRLKPFLQPGARVRMRVSRPRGRSAGFGEAGGRGEGPRPCSTIPWPWPAWPPRPRWSPAPCRSASRMPAPFSPSRPSSRALRIADIWPAVLVRFEAGLLQELGFGLDLSRCAVTGATDDLVYVSPAHRPRGQRGGGRALPGPPAGAAAVPAVGPGPAGARRRRRGPGADRPISWSDSCSPP